VKSRPPKDPLLVYLFVAGLLMTCLSLATWMGRPGTTIGQNTETEGLRALASIESSSSSEALSSSMEMVQLRLSCLEIPSVIQVSPNQHQVQFLLHNCASGDGSVEISASHFKEPLLVFPSDNEGSLDSEIVQLKEGSNQFTLEWMDQTGSLRSFEFQIRRG
jgi:hypothetical protein